MSKRRRSGARGGFSLPEVLVAVSMVGVLAAVVLPTVIGQISKGEISRVVQDIQAVNQAATMFRGDVGAWPTHLEHLTARPTTGYTVSGRAAWSGPYLSRGDVTGGLATTLNGRFNVGDGITFQTDDWGTVNFLVIAVDGVSFANAEEISLSVDGHRNLALTNDEHGKVRHASPTVSLRYFAAPRQ